MEHICKTKYMGREKLESLLDCFFAERLTEPNFLEQCMSAARRQSQRSDSAVHIQRLRDEINSLTAKRGRTIDAFIEGVISKDERDRRIARIDQQMNTTGALLLRCEGPASPLEPQDLVGAFAPLVEWESWSRDQKRSVLTSMIPDIRVADYKLETLGLNPAIFSNERSPAAAGT